jgi:class 3 adenylate cyclase
VVPEIRYAKTRDGVHIAYQVVGAGPIDLVHVPSFLSHLQVLWEEPLVVRFLERLASFSRLILFEKRGTGLSDPLPLDALPTLEERSEDLLAVLDAVGSQRAALFGSSEGGPQCILFAATHPGRTSALILWSTFPRAIQDDDFPEGWLPVEAVDADLQATEKTWIEGTFDESLDEMAEGLGARERLRVARWWERLCRMSLTPGAAVALSRIAYNYDVRDVLPTITAPTLCIVRSGDENLPATRYLAENIAGARFVELPGSAHVVYLGPQEEALAEIQAFLTGVRPAPEPSRVLATVLFADIVSSTEHVSELGDRVWSDLLETFLATVRGTIQRFDGREVDAAGDGIFAAFDGPARAVRCGSAICDRAHEVGIELRVGVHTGECERVDDRLRGVAVHIGARISSLAAPGGVLVSSTVKDLVAGSGLKFEDAGERELKGIPDRWRLYRVVSESP